MCISKMFLPSSLRSSMYSSVTAGKKARAFNKWENVACHTNYSKQTLPTLKRNNISINKHPLQTGKRPYVKDIVCRSHIMNTAKHTDYLCTAGEDGSIWKDARGHSGEQAHPGAHTHSCRRSAQFLQPDTHASLSSEWCREECRGSYTAHTNPLYDTDIQIYTHQ